MHDRQKVAVRQELQGDWQGWHFIEEISLKVEFSQAFTQVLLSKDIKKLEEHVMHIYSSHLRQF